MKYAYITIITDYMKLLHILVNHITVVYTISNVNTHTHARGLLYLYDIHIYVHMYTLQCVTAVGQ